MPRRAFWAARLFHLWDQAGIAMKVTVERAQLLKSLGHVHRVVERRNTIPILGNVLIRAENARLSLKATDLDLEVTETLAAETGAGGSTPVPARMVFEIVRKLPHARPYRAVVFTSSCAKCPTARRSCWKATATARCWRSAPAVRASRCRPCPKT